MKWFNNLSNGQKTGVAIVAILAGCGVVNSVIGAITAKKVMNSAENIAKEMDK